MLFRVASLRVFFSGRQKVAKLIRDFLFFFSFFLFLWQGSTILDNGTLYMYVLSLCKYLHSRHEWANAAAKYARNMGVSFIARITDTCREFSPNLTFRGVTSAFARFSRILSLCCMYTVVYTAVVHACVTNTHTHHVWLRVACCVLRQARKVTFI